MPLEKTTLGLPGFLVKRVQGENPAVIEVSYELEVLCLYCESPRLRKKDRFIRKVRHESFGSRPSWLWIESYKYCCLSCGKYFNSRFPGILPYKRATEPFRREVFEKHVQGISQKALSEALQIGEATVERWHLELVKKKLQEQIHSPCPKVLGIDEHFFTKKQGYATTLCDLSKHRIYDITLGRSEKSLAQYLSALEGRSNVRVVLMDMSETYRSIVEKYFSQALIVTDRFHVIRLIIDAFLKAWQQFDPIGRKNRGLLSLLRRHEKNLKPEQIPKVEKYFLEFPVLEPLYRMKEKLCQLMTQKHQTAKQCRQEHIPLFFELIEQLKTCQISALETLGHTLDSWKEEVARMWRFTKTNGITEGFHNKMEMISRRAFGFRNFENYRLRVKYACG